MLQRWISAPTSVDHYYSGNGDDSIMLEDDSGRIRLVGNALQNHFMVTGCIVAVMGTENANGEFEVIDLLFAELPPQPERWSLSKGKKQQEPEEDVEMMDASFSGNPPSKPPSKKIALVSGLEFSNADTSYAMELNLLLEYLLGEALDPSVQHNEISHITRLIIAGNSISTTSAEHAKPAPAYDTTTPVNKFQPQHKKYGYDSSSYNPIPSQLFDNFLSELLPTMPVTLLPGALDPANASYPQQPIHSAMFPQSRTYMSPPKVGGAAEKDKDDEEPGWFDNVTNPWEGEIEGWRVLGTGGQNLDDVFKYVESEDRLGMMEAMCRWRCVAPTAPDTLCEFSPFSLPLPLFLFFPFSCHFPSPLTATSHTSFIPFTYGTSLTNHMCKQQTGAYPFQEDEPFVIKECPHLFFVGCQSEFGTKVIHGPDGQAVRLVAVPSFSETREVVLVDTETLDVERVRIVTE